MLTLPSSVRVYLVLDAISMHASFDGLAAKVRRLGLDPTNGHLFLFLNKPRTHVKILFFDRTGFAIHYKRLERGTFQLPVVIDGAGQMAIDTTTLAMILEGIDLHQSARRKRFVQPTA